MDELLDKLVINENYNKPLLKWVGGKTQIIDTLLAEFPSHINNYHEIFVGGASVLIELLKRVNNKTITISGNITAYDINSDLINVYLTIQTNHILLFDKILEIKNIFNKCSDLKRTTTNPKDIDEALLSKENYYYWIRKQFNQNDTDIITKSAYFIFLNKTGFRGLFRTGKNGFNVPYGNYKNPEIINFNHLTYISKLFKNVIFVNLDFEKSIKYIKENDFTYLDPPYLPINKTSFVKYDNSGFNYDKHITLLKFINDANNDLLFSNSDSDIIKLHLTSTKKQFIYKKILCKRNINSKNPNSKVYELLIKNF